MEHSNESKCLVVNDLRCLSAIFSDSQNKNSTNHLFLTAPEGFIDKCIFLKVWNSEKDYEDLLAYENIKRGDSKPG